MTSAVILGHDRDDVPGAARAGEGDRRLQLRRRGRRVDRAARRRRAHPGDQLALDLLRQRADRRSRPRSWRVRLVDATRASASGAAPTSPARCLLVGALMLGVYTIVEARELRLGLGPHARLRRRSRWRCWPRSSCARRARATRSCRCGIFRSRNVVGREPGPGADGRRDVRDVLPRRALPAARARLRRARDRPGVPAGRALIGTLSLGFSARLNMRFGARATLLPGLVLIVVGLAAVRAGAGRRQLPDRRAAGDAAARHRRRRCASRR